MRRHESSSFVEFLWYAWLQISLFNVSEMVAKPVQENPNKNPLQQNLVADFVNSFLAFVITDTGK